MKKKSGKKKGDSGKGWASFRIRGIATSLKNLETHPELSIKCRRKLSTALDSIVEAVAILDEEKEEAEAARRLE